MSSPAASTSKPRRKHGRGRAGALSLSCVGMALAALFGPRTASANGLSVHLLSGFSTMNLQAGATFKQDGGIGLELRPQINIEWPSLNTALDMFYQGRLGSNFGSFPLSRAGTGLVYYPWGLPLQTTVLDNGVTVNQNRFAPFIMGQLALTTVAVTSTTGLSTGPVSFNGLTVGYQIGGGGELPLSQTWSLVAEFILEGTVAGGVTGNNNSSLSYSLFNGMLGISIHP